MICRARICLIACCFLAVSSATYAQEKTPGSVFFTQEEMKRIDESSRGKKEMAVPPAPALRLDSLMYFGPSRWIFWLDGKKWTPETREPKIDVLSVTPEEVTLALWQEENEEKRIVTLRVSQSAPY